MTLLARPDRTWPGPAGWAAPPWSCCGRWRATRPPWCSRRTELPLAAMAEYDRPVGIGDLVAVDTTVPVDVPAVAARVRGYHGDA